MRGHVFQELLNTTKRGQAHVSGNKGIWRIMQGLIRVLQRLYRV